MESIQHSRRRQRRRSWLYGRRRLARRRLPRRRHQFLGFPRHRRRHSAHAPKFQCSQGFLATLGPDGSNLLYATYFGGSGTTYGDYVNTLVVDANANIYFAGQTDSTDIPISQGALQAALDGALNAFVAKLARTETPSITGVSPYTGPVGSSVVIAGLNFGSAPGTVTIGGILAAVVGPWTPTSVTVQVPSGLSPGNAQAVLTTSSASTALASFVVAETLTVSGVQPPAAAIGASVTVSGIGFGLNSSGTGVVSFNGISATATNWNDSSITVIVPASATTGPLTVTANGQTSSPVAFEIGTPPSITATVSPSPNAQGWNNSFVVVTFNCTAGSSQIAFCTAPVVVTTQGQNQLITGTVTDAAGISVSAAATVSIETTQPVVAVTSPADQTTVSSSSIAVSGTVTNSLTAVTGLTCNGTAVPVTSGAIRFANSPRGRSLDRLANGKRASPDGTAPCAAMPCVGLRVSPSSHNAQIPAVVLKSGSPSQKTRMAY